MTLRLPRPSDRHDATDLIGWFATLRGVSTSQASAALRDARAVCDAMRCPRCGEQGAHRCDP